MNNIIVLNCDLTTLNVDIIVNAANEALSGGEGIDGAIHRKAGIELSIECSKLGGCKVGEVKMTDAYKLPCKKIMHTVGPIYSNPAHEILLKNCYVNSLKLAEQYRIDNNLDSITVGFPCISTGLFGYPKDEASKIAVETVRELNYKNIRVVFACYEITDYQEYVNNAYGIFIDYMD